MFRPNHLLASLGSAFALVGSLVATGCSDDPVATPRVTFDSDIKGGTHASADCGQSGAFLTMGSFGTPGIYKVQGDPASGLMDPVRPVENGAAEQQGTVDMSCSVTASGDGFNVAAQATLTGATGGSVTITGYFPRAIVGNPVDIPGITMSLTRKGETFAEKNCIARFDTVVGHAIEAGRVWGTIDCANAERPSAQKVCATHAQFRLENCAQ